MSNKPLRTLQQSLIATIGITLVGPIGFSIGDIPLTLQTFMISLFALMYGWSALLATAVYVGLGLTGLPTWSRFHAEPSIMSTESSGFIVGFFVLAIFVILTGNKLKTHATRFVGVLLGHILLLLTAFVVATVQFGESTVVIEHLPYLLTGSIIKSILVVVIFALVKPYLKQHH